ncbi:MAG: UvrD-helicase domain-containing protein [Bdellovibrionales bacterium]|nr:UvrD-helicase domain-containing protein [Bdellovibrionales bacterium]
MMQSDFHPLLFVSASAGSGKTFQLAHRFVTLLAQGAKVDEILATTFSRKAAHEIFQRVVEILIESSESEERASSTALFLSGAPFGNERALELLSQFLLQQSRLLIGTIDSFAQKVAHLFHQEIGLPEDWLTPDEALFLKNEERALRNVLQNIAIEQRGPVLSLLTSKDASRTVFSRLYSHMAKLERYAHSVPESGWSWRVGELCNEDAVATREEAYRQLSALVIPVTQKNVPNMNWKKAHESSLQDFSFGNNREFLQRGIPDAIGQGKTTFYSKPLSDDWLAAYGSALRVVIHEEVRFLCERTRQASALLFRYLVELERIQEEMCEYRFDDIKQLLVRVFESFPTGDLAYRLDRRVQHLLLDEFQDTTPMEWRMLNVVAGEILASPDYTRSLYCVGDPKQAIYGWRGGSVQLFSRLRTENPHAYLGALVKSYRSSPVVIEFVNSIFLNIASCSVYSGHGSAVSRWLEGFQQHEAEQKDYPGRTEIVSLEEIDNLADSLASRVLAELRQNPGMTIGILVRSNREILPYVLALERLGLAVSAEGGSPLTDSPLVVALLALLEAILHPGDTRAWFHVFVSPLKHCKSLLNADIDVQQIRIEDLRSAAAELNRIARSLRERIDRGELSQIVLEGVACFTEFSSPRDESRAEKLVELALRFATDGALGCERFVQSVRQARFEDVRPGVVRIMTIHKSKGLEFDSVFLPSLDYSLTKVGERPVLCEYDTDTRSPMKAILNVDRKLRQHIPRLGKMYEAELTERIYEELCVLYVSLTRARFSTTLFIQGKPSQSSAAAALLELVEAGCLRKASGDPEWMKKLSRDMPNEEYLEAREGVRLHYLEGQSRKKFLPVVTGSVSRAARNGRFQEGIDEKRGSFVHALCEQIEWLDDGFPELSKVQLFGKNLQLNFAQVRDIYAHVQSQFDITELAQVFSRLRYPEAKSCRVYRELSFGVLVEESLYRGVIDRLVLIERSNGQREAEVIDVKTGYIGEWGLEEMDSIRRQLLFYRKGVEALFPSIEGRVSCTACFIDRGEVLKF